jgi:hypothetical protein
MGALYLYQEEEDVQLQIIGGGHTVALFNTFLSTPNEPIAAKRKGYYVT